MRVPYEAPQGRRVNVIGAYFSHGSLAGEFMYQSYASVPIGSSKNKRKTLEQQAADHGLKEEEVGPIDAGRFLEFVWKVAGRWLEGGWKTQHHLEYLETEAPSGHRAG